jgi:hypothetical protein
MLLVGFIWSYVIAFEKKSRDEEKMGKVDIGGESSTKGKNLHMVSRGEKNSNLG